MEAYALGLPRMIHYVCTEVDCICQRSNLEHVCSLLHPYHHMDSTKMQFNLYIYIKDEVPLIFGLFKALVNPFLINMN